MKYNHIKIVFILIIASLILLPSILSIGCKQHSTEPLTVDSLHFPPNTRKPNIYIYPASACSLSVQLEFPNGGIMYKSIPKYSNGWNIFVSPSGKINDEYDYLFYECKSPDLYQREYGWVVSRDSLFDFFTNNLLKAGFSYREKDDFIQYWIPRLVDYPYYRIYPQFADKIEKVIKLKFSITPDNILRLFYAVEGTFSPQNGLKRPIIPLFNRKGFVVAEWGVVI